MPGPLSKKDYQVTVQGGQKTPEIGPGFGD